MLKYFTALLKLWPRFLGLQNHWLHFIVGPFKVGTIATEWISDYCLYNYYRICSYNPTLIYPYFLSYNMPYPWLWVYQLPRHYRVDCIIKPWQFFFLSFFPYASAWFKALITTASTSKMMISNKHTSATGIDRARLPRPTDAPLF